MYILSNQSINRFGYLYDLSTMIFVYPHVALRAYVLVTSEHISMERMCTAYQMRLNPKVVHTVNLHEIDVINSRQQGFLACPPHGSGWGSLEGVQFRL